VCVCVCVPGPTSASKRRSRPEVYSTVCFLQSHEYKVPLTLLTKILPDLQIGCIKGLLEDVPLSGDFH
jgi:hypothetical protein